MSDKKKKLDWLKKKRHSKTVQEYIDFDYINKLNNEEKEWLAEFVQMHYGARFKDYDLLEAPEDLKERRKVYTENDSRRRDIMSARKGLRREYESSKEQPVSADSIGRGEGAGNLKNRGSEAGHSIDLETLFIEIEERSKFPYKGYKKKRKKKK